MIRPALLFLALIVQIPLDAAGACRQIEPSPAQIQSALELGTQAERVLQGARARFALIARVGQDLSEYGLHYSHVAFVARREATEPWTVVHLLNECGTDRSSLYDEGLAAFFFGALRNEGAVFIPSPALQARLEQTLRGPTPWHFHNPAYNLVAYPFSTKYQNSNQWLLEVVVSALHPHQASGSRRMAQKQLQRDGFLPTTLELGMLKRLGGRLFRPNVEFDDHPFGRRMKGHIDTVTVDSIFLYLRRMDRAYQIVEFTGGEPAP